MGDVTVTVNSTIVLQANVNPNIGANNSASRTACVAIFLGIWMGETGLYSLVVAGLCDKRLFFS